MNQRQPSRVPLARGDDAASVSPVEGRTMVRLLSGDFFGMEGRPVEVQVDVAARGSPGFNIVGLAGKSIRESRERIRTAIRNSGLRYPHNDRILVNLAPAAEEKEGAGFDLAVAMGILLATGQVAFAGLSRSGLVAGAGFLGELGLNGEVRPVPGALLTAYALQARGVTRMVISPGNAREAALVEGIEVFPAEDLHAAVRVLVSGFDPALSGPDAGPEDAGPLALAAVPPPPGGAAAIPDFADVRGQEATKRGLLIAAAGDHNVILSGPPGLGKTLLARCLPGILPPMTFSEALDVTRIRSVICEGPAGILAAARPFRAPHHTISFAGLVGGGARLRPGEVTRAHRGVLFLDELPEFDRRTLEALREPLEEGRITVGRSSGSVTFPASFLLAAAMNPCPCGYHGHPRRACTCTPHEVRAYRQRLSGPLLDRVDIFIQLGPVRPEDLVERPGKGAGLGTAALAEEVRRAGAVQGTRWGAATRNARVSLGRLLAEGQVARAALDRLRASAERWSLSARAFTRSLRVARTIADLDGSPAVEDRHVAEALHYREQG